MNFNFNSQKLFLLNNLSNLQRSALHLSCLSTNTFLKASYILVVTAHNYYYKMFQKQKFQIKSKVASLFLSLAYRSCIELMSVEKNLYLLD